MKNSKNSTMFGMGTLPPPPLDAPEKANLTLPPLPPPPPPPKEGDVKNVAVEKDLPIPPPPPPPPPPLEDKKENSESEENSEEIALARTMLSNLDLDAIPPTNNPTNKIRKDVVSRASKVSEVSSVSQTVAFGNQEIKGKINKHQLPKGFADLPITYSGKTPQSWMRELIDKKSATKQNAMNVKKIETYQSISETLKDCIAKDHAMKISISEIYEKIISPKLETISNPVIKNQYIDQCDEFFKTNIEEKFLIFKTRLKNLSTSQENPTSIIENLPFFLQTMFEGRVFSKATRRHILRQVIDLIQIVEIEVEKQKIDEGTGKYLKHGIVDALGHAITMTRFNKDKKTTLSPSTDNITKLVNKFPGKQEVEIKEALTFPHPTRENPNEILNLNNDIENIIKNPEDPSYKDAAEKLRYIVKRAQNFTLLESKLMRIETFYYLQKAIDEFSNEWRNMLEIIEKPRMLDFLLSKLTFELFKKKITQYKNLDKIQTIILEKIIKPQVIVLSEMLLSKHLFIPDNIPVTD
jgi:hypothetical protein